MVELGLDRHMDHQGPGRSKTALDLGLGGSRAARERAIAELASRQRGLATRKQLLRLGMTRDAIDNRVRSSLLHALHRGVYLVGHGHMAPGARELAATLACGPNAVVSHRSAAWLWRLLAEPDGEPEVIVFGRDCRRAGIRTHLLASLPRRDVRRLGGIPVTSPPRTLLDLAAVVALRDLERATAEAQVRGLTRPSELLSLLARAGRRPGVAALRSVIEADAGRALTRSELEERFLALIRRAGLPTPDVNARAGSLEVDFLWRDHRLIVEVDGFRFHSSRAAFERDRRRDAELTTLGYRVLRVTWRQLVGEPESTLVLVAQALALAQSGR